MSPALHMIVKNKSDFVHYDASDHDEHAVGHSTNTDPR